MDKNLKYFMRKEAREEQVIEVPGLESIRDESGNVIPLKIRKLHNDKIEKINSMYEERVPLRDSKKNYVVQNGEVVYRVTKDRSKAARHMIAEALVQPDLHDAELMKFFDCEDIADMPIKVFPDNKEYGYVAGKVLEILGLKDEDDAETEIQAAKNS